MKNHRWRPMQEQDLERVEQVMLHTYPHLPEDIACIRERLRLFPAGCHVLLRDGDEMLVGYLISHPWKNRGIPPLSSLLGSLPFKAEVYYIHDIALLPDAQGIGAAQIILSQISEVARGLFINRFALVALSSAKTFWSKHGFRPISDRLLDQKLMGYGAGSQYMQRAVD